MSFAAPGFLAAALAVAVATVALHLLVLRPPPASLLPTARFVPAEPSLVRRREPWPRDRLLLALRVSTILLAGAAFARPSLWVRRTPSMRIVAVDRAGPAAMDSAARYLRPADVLIAFDSSLSAALVAARRAAARVSADSIELVVISPFMAAERDAATQTIRAAWPAAIRTVRVPLVASPTTPATIRWLAPVGAVDTIGAVVMDGVVAIAPFTRARDAHLPAGTVIARWVDGQPAAVEHDCMREIAIGNPTPQLRAALDARPCGARPSAPLADSAVRALAGTGPLAATFAIERGRGDRALMTVLLVLASAAALAEWLFR